MSYHPFIKLLIIIIYVIGVKFVWPTDANQRDYYMRDSIAQRRYEERIYWEKFWAILWPIPAACILFILSFPIWGLYEFLTWKW